MWKTHVKEIVLWGVLIIAFIIIGSSTYFVTSPQTRATTSAEAGSDCKCTDDDVCYPDGCTRKPKTSDNKFSESRYDQVCEQFKPGWPPSAGYQSYMCGQHQPDCCSDMVAYQDSRMCCFMERWHCHPNYCNQLSGDKGDCGKYWGIPSGWNEYGCVKKDESGNKVPKYGLAPGIPGSGGTNPTAIPTTPPQATATPPSTPTPTIRQNNTMEQTTATPQPQNNNNGNNSGGNNTSQSGVTRYPIVQLSPTTVRAQSNNSVNSLNRPAGLFNNQNDDGSFDGTNAEGNSDSVLLPGLNKPQLNLQVKAPNQILRETITTTTVEKLNRATDPPLMAAEMAVITIKSYDAKLEETVEGWIFSIRDRILELF